MARNRQAHEGPDFEPAPATKKLPADPAVPRKSLQSELLRLQGAGGNQMVVRMMEAANNAQGAAEHLRERIASQLGRGEPLSRNVQAEAEADLGASMDGVRVHRDTAAAGLAEDLGARAFTTGQDVFFGAGAYDPSSTSGYGLLAHELAHTAQQSDGQVAGKPVGSSLTVSTPHDHDERAADQAADRASAQRAARHSAGAGAAAVGEPSDTAVQRHAHAGADLPSLIQRKATEMSLDFLASGSDVTFTPDGLAFSPATSKNIDYTDFPDGFNGEVRIDAGTTAVVRIGMRIHIFEDNWIINERLDQKVFVDWTVTAAADGKLTIDPTAKVWRGEPSNKSIRAGLTDIGAKNGPGYVMINPVIASGGGSGGVSMVVGRTENAPSQSVSAPFTLSIGVDNIAPPKEPTGTVTIGEISMQKTHDVYFPAPKNGKGQSAVVNDEITKFAVWYSSLSETTRKRIEKGELAVELSAFTSTTGDVAYNEWLSDQRRDSVEQLLRRRAGRDAKIERSRALGKLDTPTPDQKETAEWRKVVITVFDVMSEGEKPPASVAP
ncbi:DUF4157 domain-containing protein [Paractinoplanes rhizophilus]|jgi:outer membrane protein OmpA-like peptidoglycan-associated protein|uniref:DUF4157 domain-containing protein n=1 Tax=Paractinoplanes rhizophilus TaxID=1416877 RepID=A0ABW2I1I7_9ACTN|nr:DUF4157 domain-containing protein [Actinoplanes sp.]